MIGSIGLIMDTSFKMPKPTVIIIDMLVDFFRDGHLKTSRQRMAEAVNKLVTNARKKDFPIIWIKQEFEPDLSDAFLHMRENRRSYTIKDTQGAQLLPELEVDEKDIIVVKKRYSAFFRTNLDQILQQLAPEYLTIAGITTAGCVRMTAMDAYQRDYHVVLVEDCLDAFTPEDHRSSLQYMRTTFAKVVQSGEL